jgi:segregation and condensation protein A
VVSFDQVTPLGELTVRWTGGADAEVEVSDEFDGGPGGAADAAAGPAAGERTP